MIPQRVAQRMGSWAQNFCGVRLKDSGQPSRKLRGLKSGDGLEVNDPDRALIEAALTRDERAMEQIYRRYAPAIHSYALRATHDVNIAEEVTQDTFVRAFRSLQRFEGRSTFRTWLFSIAVNRVRTAAKKVRHYEDLDESLIEAESPRPRPWLKCRLSKALGELPEGYREVVIMHDVLGMGHEEIANVRRCSVGTSKSQLHKARARLRGLLGGPDA